MLGVFFLDIKCRKKYTEMVLPLNNIYPIIIKLYELHLNIATLGINMEKAKRGDVTNDNGRIMEVPHAAQSLT